MPDIQKDLGRLVSEHGTSPNFLHRMVIVAALSMFFFLFMLVTFFLRQQIIFFMLSSAFLVLYVLSMAAILVQRRKKLQIFENGLTYKKFTAVWDDIRSIRSEPGSGITITRLDGATVQLGSSIAGLEQAARAIRWHLPH
ncbi:MAG: hypothetical protein ABI539_11340 [Acidobacteriota bacterium]